MKDTFLTISSLAEGIYKEKGSKFMAYLHPVSTEGELKEIVKAYKKTYYDARHHCYALIINPSHPLLKAADDGEPAHSAGTPILNQLRAANLCNVACIVVRYFGGTKLGVPGLIHAYKTAAEDAIQKAEIIEKEITANLKIQFSYPQLTEVLKICKDFKASILNQLFDNECQMEMEIRLGNYEQMKEKLEKVEGLEIN